MNLLDTDHLSVLQVPSGDRRNRLVARMALAGGETFGTTVVTAEEQMRGWLASVAKERLVRRQVGPYRELGRLFVFYRVFPIAPFDEAAAETFDRLRAAKVRISTMDLKIAAVAISTDSLLLTANRRDFEQVPGLRFANWLD